MPPAGEVDAALSCVISGGVCWSLGTAVFAEAEGGRIAAEVCRQLG